MALTLRLTIQEEMLLARVQDRYELGTKTATLKMMLNTYASLTKNLSKKEQVCEDLAEKNKDLQDVVTNAAGALQALGAAALFPDDRPY